MATCAKVRTLALSVPRGQSIAAVEGGRSRHRQDDEAGVGITNCSPIDQRSSANTRASIEE